MLYVAAKDRGDMATAAAVKANIDEASCVSSTPPMSVSRKYSASRPSSSSAAAAGAGATAIARMNQARRDAQTKARGPGTPAQNVWYNEFPSGLTGWHPGAWHDNPVTGMPNPQNAHGRGHL